LQTFLFSKNLAISHPWLAEAKPEHTLATPRRIERRTAFPPGCNQATSIGDRESCTLEIRETSYSN
jgi:hypothetical protein